MWAAYYHYHTTQDTLMIVIDPSSYPTKIIKKDEVVALYDNETLIGINILKFSNTIKMKTNGRVLYLPPLVMKIINDKLNNASLDSLESLPNNEFMVARVMKVLGNSITLLIDNEVINMVTDRAVRLESKVVLAKKGTILFNLDIVKEEYRILNGFELGYDYNEVVEVEDDINVGEDYFKNQK